MKKLILLLITLSTIYTFGQKTQFVNAPNGLIIRKEPNKTSERIGKLQYGDRVDIIRITELPISIVDEDSIINGYWTEVKESNHTPTGFIFNGYLSSNVINKGKETKNFYLTEIPPVMIKNYLYNMMNSKETKPAIIYLRDKKNENIFDFSIYNLESFESTNLYELGNKGLLNIEKIITVAINYNSCCSNHYYTHLLQTNEDKIIELPDFDYVHCDGPEPYKDYLFPDDTNGKKDKILYVKVNPSNDSIPENIEILKTYSWNGKNIAEE
tara:strand:- start:150 stop:956 length:807 start_codon:yes stop_codon:yes gene_type:complete